MKNTNKDILRSFLFSSILLISCVTGQSCEHQCGVDLKTCSCHQSCDSLQTCCTDYQQFCVDIHIYSGTMFGGTDFMVFNATFDPDSTLFCRFSGEVQTKGYVDRNGRGHCISPLLFETGQIPFEISTDDGVSYNVQGTWVSVFFSQVDPGLKVMLVNSTQWQYYGTPNTGGRLQMTWSMSHIRADQVNVELWGYRETGEPYSDSWLPEWKYLYSLGKDLPNNGKFSFIPKSAEKPFSEWHLGSIRVCPSSSPDGTWNVNALWSEPHALAWHLEAPFRQDSAAWALERCLDWNRLESTLGSFLNETIDCPCTLAQAQADTTRFHADNDCDITKGSVCTYHPGCVHCVRAIQASPKYGAGQQCCYDSAGDLVLTGDSVGGSTPDRGHVWGSPPYRRPPRVPGLSHWLYDVISFYYCCLWSESCHYYFTHRPSSDCRSYKAPKAGVVFGNIHFITFSGTEYTLNGEGEHYLVQSDKGLTVQGRMEPVKLENGTLMKASMLAAVVMKENTSDVIEVRLSSQRTHLDVLKNQQVLSLVQQNWMGLNGVLLFSSAPQNITATFPSGAGVEVRAKGGSLTATVMLPLELSEGARGLLAQKGTHSESDHGFGGYSNGDDPFSPEASWVVANGSSLFTYDSEPLWNFSRRLGLVSLLALKDPKDPFSSEVSEQCIGEGSRFCSHDALPTRSLAMGNASQASFQAHVALVKDLKPVLSCGWLASPRNGQKEGRKYLEGATVRFSCSKGYTLSGSSDRTCRNTGQWSGDTTHCVSENTLGMVLGSVFTALTLMTMMVTITLHIRKQQRSPSGKQRRVQKIDL